ncbi:MAG: universal stress protein [Cyanobacteria bacterium SZAS LIN-2]|nr:universal stress protein [Cyanobacteria bacterium SZAS LIN-3]MBS1995788.1 universal stress protein [Cyanobacteria bacterium SZAS LIN-2]MBS2009402.1 universal stress protein [Cyanobacteria bacterium SZAS TMP-1]
MNILFAVDGSRCSANAIDHALTMRCPAGTALKVVSVVDCFDPLPAVHSVKEKQVEAARKLVADIVEKLKKAHPEADVSGEVLDGAPAIELLHCSREWPAHLIVVGSHGRSGLSELWLGSVSRAILTHAPCAVRIVRNTSKDASSAQNVLLAIDDSEHSEHLVEHVLALPWAVGTRFQCLHVVPELNVDVLLDPDTGFATTLAQHYDDQLHSEKKRVAKVVEKIDSAFGQSVATAHVALGEPRKQILEHAANWPADLIMVGSHGRRGFELLVMGSVSEAVATQAKCAVEVTRMPVKRKAKLHYII